MPARPSAEEVRSLLSYEPSTGKLTWLPRTSGWSGFNTLYAGEEAFTAVDSGGYKIGSLNKVRYRAHQLIWLIVHGEWPEVIDHIDGNRQNNRIENLRSVTHAENRKNAARYKTNSTGVSGVQNHSDGGFSVYIGARYVGYSKCFDTAVKIRKAAETAHNYHENHGRN